MKTGMIIVHYNDLGSIMHLIDNVKDYSIINKIIIVDNNSNISTKVALRKFTNEKIELIENSENKGFSYAINIGAKRLIEELGECNLIVSNSDVIIEKETDLLGLTNLLAREEVGVVAPTIIERNSLNRGWKNPSPKIDALMNLVYIHRIIRKKKVFYPDTYYNDRVCFVEVVSGCFFLIKSKDLERIGFLDENVFLYYEENILAKRIEKINKKIMLCNDIKIVHNHSVSINKNIKKIYILKIQKRSQVYFHKTYNNANGFQILMLKLTAFLSRIILSIIYTLEDLVQKK